MKKFINLHFDLNMIASIAKKGIENAVSYSRIAESATYSLESFKNYKPNPDKIMVEYIPTGKNIDENLFDDHKNQYILWVLSNSVSDIVESFYFSLEHCVCAVRIPQLEISGERTISSQEELDVVISEIRNNYRSFNKIKNFLNSQGQIIQDKHVESIESFNEVRNILTHNRGIYDGRLGEAGKDEVLRWKYLRPFIRTQDGKELSIEETTPLESSVCVQLERREVELKKGQYIHFKHLDVQEIALTFNFIIDDIARNVVGLIKKMVRD